MSVFDRLFGSATPSFPRGATFLWDHEGADQREHYVYPGETLTYSNEYGQPLLRIERDSGLGFRIVPLCLLMTLGPDDLEAHARHLRRNS